MVKTGDVTLSEEQRLTLALLLAVAIHAVILSIHLALPETNQQVVYSVNVNLLKQEHGEPAAKSASMPVTPPKPTPSRPVSMPPSPVTIPARTALSALVATLAPANEQAPPPRQLAQRPPIFAAKPSKPFNPTDPPRPNSGSAPLTPLPFATDLNSGLQVVRTRESIRPSVDYAREKHINPESMTTLEEYYVQTWERKIEKVATLNFPKEALQRRLSGSLTLDVALNRDGSVHSITLLESSGYPLLDNAAREIVELAGPYSPFPEELSRKYDILHISRIWNFLQGDLLD